MNITCSHTRLRSALESCERVIARHLTLPVLNNVLLKAENNKLTISATNLEIGIVTTLPCKTEAGGELTVPARVLNGIVANLTGDTVTFLSGKGTELAIKAGGYSGTIKGEKGDEFPIIPTLKKTPLFTFKGTEFSAALASVMSFTAVSDTRPELTGVFFSKPKGQKEVDLVAADGFRLAQRKLADPAALVAEEFSFIVPQRTIAEVVRMAKDSETIEVVFDEKQVEFRSEGFRLVSRIIEGTYPNHTALIPKTFNTSVTLDVEETVKNIRLVSLLSSRINDVRLIVKSQEKEVVFKSQDPDLGESSAAVEAGGEGEDVEVSFNWRYLLEGFQNLSDKKALMRLIDSEKAALIQSPKSKEYIYVVMPLRT